MVEKNIKSGNKYSSIQVLRFIAASLVVFDHAFSAVIKVYSLPDVMQKIAWICGECGVIVFFGISGFIMINTQYRSFGSASNSFNFICRRVIRILPTYFLATTAAFINKINVGGVYNFANYIKSLIFIPYIGIDGGYRPILPQGWTLDYEIFFYVVFAASLTMKRGYGLLFSICIFSALSMADFPPESYGETLSFYGDSILIYFVMGIVAALLCRKSPFPIANVGAAVTISSLIITAIICFKLYLPDLPVVFFGAASVFVIIYVCGSVTTNHNSRVIAFLEKLGDASYSTYLFHGFFIGAATVLLNRIHGFDMMIVISFTVICMICSNFLGLGILQFIENPLSRYFNGRYAKWRQAMA